MAMVVSFARSSRPCQPRLAVVQFRLLIEAAVTAAEDAAIRAGLCRCFPPDVAVFSQTRAWHGSTPSFTVVAECGAEIAAHAGIVERTIRVGREPLRAAGVQNVYVLPEHRGQGLFRRVMAAAMDEARRRGLDVGLLFCTPEIARKYAHLHWQTLDGPTVTRVDEFGWERPLPKKNVTMYFPLARNDFPRGDIHLLGNDW